MSLQHKFVISVDEGGIYFDDETIETHFNGEVWDTEKSQWFRWNHNKKIQNSYEIAESKLEEAITTGLDFMEGGD